MGKDHKKGGIAFLQGCRRHVVKVLVTDGANRVALFVARALGMKGCKVFVVEQEKYRKGFPLAFYSRFVSRSWFVPPLGKGFIERIIDLSNLVDLIIPIATNTVLCLAGQKERIQRTGVKIFLPPLETIRIANSKDSLLKLAEKLGVPTPKTFIPEGKEDLGKVQEFFSFPLILKLKNDEGLFLEPAQRYRIVYNQQELYQKYVELELIKPRPLIQEYIKGDGVGFFAILKEGVPLAIFCHRRLREYPPEGGPSSCCVSIYSEKLLSYGLRLLKELRWHGPAMVEFKQDSRDGEYKLMEINPRFWGSLPLAIACGVNFPYILTRLAVEDFPLPMPRYKLGVKLRFLNLELFSLLAVVKDRIRRGVYFRGFFKDMLDPSVKEGFLSFNDPAPAIAYFVSKVL